MIKMEIYPLRKIINSSMIKFKKIDIHSAISRINKDDITIIDIRDKESFKLGHIDGAINLSNNNIDDFICNTRKDKSIIVCCYHGNSSQSAAEFLVKSGFNDVYSLDGGYEAWKIRNNNK